ncbi:MAG: ABC transporter transmembrane domain-containing protein [Bacteriovoracaceae bacterium]
MLSQEEKELLTNRSILNLIFTEDEIEDVLRAGFVEPCEAGATIVEEGSIPKHVLIPLNGLVELFSVLGHETIINGVVQPGRTINTYSILREVPYQYSARFKEPGAVIRIPMRLVHDKLAHHPELRTYLLGMTESHDIRRLAKDIQSIGCSVDFKVNFLASLTLKEFRPQEWLNNPNEVPTEALYLLEGQLTSQRFKPDPGKPLLQIQVPSRSWFGWKSLVDEETSRHILKSVTGGRFFSLSSELLNKLKQEFPEDFELYHESIVAGNQTEKEDDEEGEEVDIESLIKESVRPKKKFWKSLPWVQQSDQMDCGPACMAMISAYYNHKIPIQYWRTQMSTGRDGTSLFDLALTSERNGFTSCALSVEDLSTLDKDFFPAIALRQYHYLVIYSVTKKAITVGDPAIGIVRMKPEEFYEGFEQSILFLKPNEAFFELPVTGGQYKHFFQMLEGLHKELFLSFSVSLMLVLLGLLTPVLSQVFLDDILVNRDENLLKIVLGVAVGVTLIQGFLGWARAYYVNYVGIKYSYKANTIFMKKMLSLNYKFFADRHVGDFTKRLGELDKIRNFLLSSFEEIILACISIIIYTTALLFYSPMVAGAFFAVVPVFFLISFLSGNKLSGIYQKIFKESAELNSQLTDTIKAIPTVKSMTAELACRWRYEEKFVNLSKASRDFSLAAATLNVISSFYTGLVNYLIMGLCGWLAIKGELSPGQVVAVTMISGNILNPLLLLASKVDDAFEIKAAMGRINDILLAPSEGSQKKGRLKKDSFLGEIEFKDVWFRYGGEGSDWVLKGVNFKIEPGQNVAFVGPSGSGKSTIAALIARMFEPTKGQIFIDGRDYLDYDISWLRSRLGILHQESHLFHGTIMENIAFSAPDIDTAKVVEAAERAAAHEFIQKKPNDYYYMISAGGFGLSGGEKQRIALARTFYRDPSILILDEATSALDGIAETNLLQRLKDQVTGTTINIAHRYSTVMHSDYALVLFEGRVVGFGTHDDLSRDNEIYQKLFGVAQEEKLPENVLKLGEGVA